MCLSYLFDFSTLYITHCVWFNVLFFLTQWSSLNIFSFSECDEWRELWEYCFWHHHYYGGYCRPGFAEVVDEMTKWVSMAWCQVWFTVSSFMVFSRSEMLKVEENWSCYGWKWMLDKTTESHWFLGFGFSNESVQDCIRIATRELLIACHV